MIRDGSEKTLDLWAAKSQVKYNINVSTVRDFNQHLGGSCRYKKKHVKNTRFQTFFELPDMDQRLGGCFYRWLEKNRWLTFRVWFWWWSSWTSECKSRDEPVWKRHFASCTSILYKPNLRQLSSGNIYIFRYTYIVHIIYILFCWTS